MNIFFHEKSHPFTSWASEKKNPACCHIKVVFAPYEEHGQRHRIYHVFKWKSKILVCLCIFYKHFWVKINDTILFTDHFYLGWKENSLKFDWDPVGRGAFRENCYDFNETAAAPKLLSLLNRSSSWWKVVV